MKCRVDREVPERKILLPYSYKKNGGRILFCLTLKLRLKIT